MDFSLTEAQHDIGGLAQRILGDHAGAATSSPDGAPDGAADGAPDEATEFDKQLWSDMAGAGLLDAALPTAVGGGGFGLLEQCSVLIEAGRTLAAIPYLSTITAAASTLAEFGTAAHIERWIIPITRGQTTMALALPDGHTGGAVTARRADDGWVLSGTVTAVANGAIADGLLCAAATPQGEALFVLGARHAGVAVHEQQVVDGRDAASLELTEVAVDDEALVAQPGSGATDWLRMRATIGWCAAQLGVCSRALEMTSEYAADREQFGEVIGSFQAVRQRLADAYVDVEAVRLTLWQAAWRFADGQDAAEQAATAKFWAAQAGHRVAHTAVHIHGGMGIDTDYPLHRYFVAAKRAEFALGGATQQLRTLGTILAETPA